MKMRTALGVGLMAPLALAPTALSHTATVVPDCLGFTVTATLFQDRPTNTITWRTATAQGTYASGVYGPFGANSSGRVDYLAPLEGPQVVSVYLSWRLPDNTRTEYLAAGPVRVECPMPPTPPAPAEPTPPPPAAPPSTPAVAVAPPAPVAPPAVVRLPAPRLGPSITVRTIRTPCRAYSRRPVNAAAPNRVPRLGQVRVRRAVDGRWWSYRDSFRITRRDQRTTIRFAFGPDCGPRPDVSVTGYEEER